MRLVCGFAVALVACDSEPVAQTEPVPWSDIPTDLQPGPPSDSTGPDPITLMSPRLDAFPASTCIDSALIDLAGLDEVESALDLWDNAVPEQVFDVVGPCTGSADLRLLYDPDLELPGITSRNVSQVDIVVGNPPNPWVFRADVEEGACTDQIALNTFLAREIGHAMGIPNSCEFWRALRRSRKG